MSTHVVLRGCTVIDVANRTVAPGTSIRVADGVITDVGPDRGAEAGPAEQIVDCTGKYVVPGLIDVHTHIHANPHRGPSGDDPVPHSVHGSTERERHGMLTKLATFLYCGVTSIFDAGNDADLIFSLRDDERAGTIDAPRIFCTGAFVTCTGGHGSAIGSATEINSLPADADRLYAHLERKPDLLKITYDEHNWGVRPLIPILGERTLAGIIEIAHEAKTRVTTHVSNEFRARQALAAGADTLAHPVIQSPATEQLIWRLASRPTPVASTLAIGERYFRLADRPEFLDDPLYVACLDTAERRRLRTSEHDAQRANRWADWMRVMTPVAQENIRALVAAGGIVATGSDLSFGPDLHREMELVQAAGVPTWEVLRAATLNGARFLGRQSTMGAVSPGYVADLLVVDADPTQDVSNLARIHAVVKAGRLVDRDALTARIAADGS